MNTRQSNKLDFKGQNIYTGIDVHLKSWSVAVLSEHSVLKRFRQDPSPESLHKFLTTHYPGAEYYSVYEAGFSGFWIHDRLVSLGINNMVVNPADVPTMSKEKIRKTDSVDCGKLARELRSGTLEGIHVPSVETLEMRSLIRLRNRIIKDTTREKNRIKSFLRFHGINIPEEFTGHSVGNWSKKFMGWLRGIELSTGYGRMTLDMHMEKFTSLRRILLEQTRALRTLSRSEALKEPIRLLTSVPGIGIVTAMSLAIEIDDIGRFPDAGSLASYIGLVPMCHSSGEKHDNGNMTVRKHAMLRYHIIEAAWTTIRKDPAMTMAYEGYRKRMDAPHAIVKIARKLVNRIFYVLKHGQEYVPCVVE